MSDKIIDVDYTQINNNPIDQKYYSIEDISDILKIEEHTVIFWCNKFNDILKIQSIGQYLVFDDNDLDNLRKIKKLNIDEKMNVASIKKYLKENNHVIINRQQNLSEKSIVSILAKIINSQNRKINVITDSHNKLLKSNQKIIENQEKFIQMLSNYHQEICIDKLNQKEILTTIQENQIKGNEILTEKLEENSKEVSNKVEEVKTHINESTEKSLEIQQENKKKLDEVSEAVITLKEENDEIKELLKDAVNKQRKSRERKLGGFIDRILGKDE